MTDFALKHTDDQTIGVKGTDGDKYTEFMAWARPRTKYLGTDEPYTLLKFPREEDFQEAMTEWRAFFE